MPIKLEQFDRIPHIWALFGKGKHEKKFVFHMAHWDKAVITNTAKDVEYDKTLICRIKIKVFPSTIRGSWQPKGR